MLNRFFILIFLFFTCQTVFADSVFNHKKNLSYITANLPELNSVFCKYNQEKFIPSSNITLKSSGDFKFEKNVGITFFVKEPAKTVITYTNKDYKQINSIINAISNRQYSKLEKEFEFYYLKQGEDWILGLKPINSSRVENYLTSVEVTGRTDISKIVIISKDKIKTTIRFFK